MKQIKWKPPHAKYDFRWDGFDKIRVFDKERYVETIRITPANKMTINKFMSECLVWLDKKEGHK